MSRRGGRGNLRRHDVVWWRAQRGESVRGGGVEASMGDASHIKNKTDGVLYYFLTSTIHIFQ
jgi:hypothetical protein